MMSLSTTATPTATTQSSSNLTVSHYTDIKVEFESSILKEFGPQSNSKCFTEEKRQEFIDRLLAADTNKDLPKQIRGFALGDDNHVWDQSEWKYRAKAGERVHLWTKKTFSSSAKNLGIIRRIVVLEEFFDLIKSLHERPSKDGYNGQKKLFNMIKNRYACLPRDAVDKYITLWRRKATNQQQAGLSNNASPSGSSACSAVGTSSSAAAAAPESVAAANIIYGNSSSPLLLQQQQHQSSSSVAAAADSVDCSAAAAAIISAAISAAANISATINAAAFTTADDCAVATAATAATVNADDSTASTTADRNTSQSSRYQSGEMGKATICHYSNTSNNYDKPPNAVNSLPTTSNSAADIISQLVNTPVVDKFSGISMVYQPSHPPFSISHPSTSLISQPFSSPLSSQFISSIPSFNNDSQQSGTNGIIRKYSDIEHSLKENNYDNDEMVPSKRIKLEDADSDTNTENEEENISPSNTDSSAKINGIKKPTDVDMAYNLFVRRVVDTTLDRTVTFCEQPKNAITGLETICADAFPSVDKNRHRVKIRGYLKACRRNSKKHNGKVAMKDTPSHMCSEKAYDLANDAMTRVESELDRLKIMKQSSECDEPVNGFHNNGPLNGHQSGATISHHPTPGPGNGIVFPGDNSSDSNNVHRYQDYMESALLSSNFDGANNSSSVANGDKSTVPFNPAAMAAASLANWLDLQSCGLDPSMFGGAAGGLLGGQAPFYGPMLADPLLMLPQPLLPLQSQAQPGVVDSGPVPPPEPLSQPPPAHSSHTHLPGILAMINGCSIYPHTTDLLQKMLHASSVDPDMGMQLLANRSASQEAISCMRIAARYLLTRSLMVESYLVREVTKMDFSNLDSEPQ